VNRRAPGSEVVGYWTKPLSGGRRGDGRAGRFKDTIGSRTVILRCLLVVPLTLMCLATAVCGADFWALGFSFPTALKRYDLVDAQAGRGREPACRSKAFPFGCPTASHATGESWKFWHGYMHHSQDGGPSLLRLAYSAYESPRPFRRRTFDWESQRASPGPAVTHPPIDELRRKVELGRYLFLTTKKSNGVPVNGERIVARVVTRQEFALTDGRGFVAEARNPDRVHPAPAGMTLVNVGLTHRLWTWGDPTAHSLARGGTHFSRDAGGENPSKLD